MNTILNESQVKNILNNIEDDEFGISHDDITKAIIGVVGEEATQKIDAIIGFDEIETIESVANKLRALTPEDKGETKYNEVFNCGLHKIEKPGLSDVKALEILKFNSPESFSNKTLTALTNYKVTAREISRILNLDERIYRNTILPYFQKVLNVKSLPVIEAVKKLVSDEVLMLSSEANEDVDVEKEKEKEPELIKMEKCVEKHKADGMLPLESAFMLGLKMAEFDVNEQRAVLEILDIIINISEEEEFMAILSILKNMEKYYDK